MNTQNTQHQLTVQEIPHTCGGGNYETHVTCSCGYAGTEARIGRGCADRDAVHEDLDATHTSLLATYYAEREDRQAAEWQTTHKEATA